MRASAIVGAGVAAYLVFLVVFLPASVVSRYAAEATAGAVQLQTGEGSIWRGSGRALIATPLGPVAIENLRWNFAPSRLLSARLAFQVQGEAAGFAIAGELARSPARWIARGVDASGAASGVSVLLPLLASWRPEGAVQLQVGEASWDGRDLAGNASLEWREAALALSEVRPLGSYRVELRGKGGPAAFTLLTLKGPLQVTGHGTYAPPSRLAFTGQARAEGASAARLAGLLELLGPRRTDGAHGIQFDTGAAARR